MLLNILIVLAFGVVFAVLNRWRGMDGTVSKVIGLILAYGAYALTHNHYVALSFGIGYIIGECFKWGVMVGDLTDNGHEDIKGSRKKLFIRGLIWWLCLLPLVFFIPFYYVLIAIVFLGACFPLACEIGYALSKFKTVPKYLHDGWSWQEAVYGLFQGIALSVLYLVFRSLQTSL